MGRGQNGPLKRLGVNATLVIAAAFPQSRRKSLARALGCTERQARRIIDTGDVPEALQEKFLEIAESTLGSFSVLLGVIRERRRQIAYRRQVAGHSGMDRAAHRERAGQALPQASQTTLPLVIDDGG